MFFDKLFEVDTKRLLLRANKISPHLLICLVVTFVTLLYFGLRSKGYDADNNVSWLEERAGLHFGDQTVVYSRPGIEAFRASGPGAGLSIEVALKPEAHGSDNFRFIVVAHRGNDAKQLLLGQWRSWIIVMQGDDYDGKRKQRRLSFEVAPARTESLFVSVVSGNDGTRLYVDGELKKADRKMFLKWPDGAGKTHLVIGSSVYGRNFWQGEINGLSLYGRALEKESVVTHFQQWRMDKTLAFCSTAGPELLYVFDEKAGDRVNDHSGGGHHLQIPGRFRILKKEILALPRIEMSRSLIMDAVLNFMGFVPFGFLLLAFFNDAGLIGGKYAWRATVLVSLGLSLAIEIAQVWMPFRSSHMLDLVLNTGGAWAGTVLHRVWRPWRV